ncbi:hypothetical protein [Rossellomorea marisflavi]|uniref:hypothetical protein n=1 Tax=Rossellomorea marisflavi TaxID=189381 RepID=UPI00345D5BA4
MIDGEKLVLYMDARMKNLQQLVDRDMGGDTSHLYSQYWELKYWLEAILRSEYDFKEGNDETL